MFKVVWKSFKYNRKNFLSFFMSEILSVAVIFMLIYIQEALSQVPGIKTEALQFAYQSELRKQLRIIIPCIILIMILVTCKFRFIGSPIPLATDQFFRS